MKMNVLYVIIKLKIKMIILIVINANKNFVINVITKQLKLQQEKTLVLIVDNMAKCLNNIF